MDYSDDAGKPKGRAIVLYSGGLDSTVLLHWAKDKYEKVLALCFDYGQNNGKQEFESVRVLTSFFGVEHRITSIVQLQSFLASGYTTGMEVKASNSYVPNRNILFVTLAHAFAQLNDYDTILLGLVKGTQIPVKTGVKGVTFEDKVNSFSELAEAGMFTAEPAPDAKDNFSFYTNEYFNDFGGWNDRGAINIIAPFSKLTKQDLYRLAEQRGILQDVIAHTSSCFNSGTKTHLWGFGCGECYTCLERAWAWKMFKEAKEKL